MNDITSIKARTYGNFLNLTNDQYKELKEFWKLVLDRLNNKQIIKKENNENNKSTTLSTWSFNSILGRPSENCEDLKISNKDGEELKSILSKIMRRDHPDIKAVKYLIARKWKAKDAYKMFINSLDYFGQDIHEQVWKEGERSLSSKLNGSNECFFYHNCKDGRLIMYIIAAKSFPSKYTIDDCLKYFLVNINNSYLLLGNQARITVVIDMNGFTLANTDLNHLKMLANTFPSHFPETTSKFIIHGAPWIFNSVWSVVSTLLDPRTRAKFVFTQKDEIKKYIDEEALLVDLSGSNNFKFDYFPPSEKEGLPKAYDDKYYKLSQERRELIEKFEDLTYKWIESDNNETKVNRDEIANQLASNHVKMSEYEYCTNIYHRLGIIQGYDDINWKV